MEEKLLKLENEFARAVASNDADALDRLLADDWIIVEPDGGMIDKARFLGVIRSGALSHESMESTEPRIRVYGYIEARDMKTNKKLWELTVFTNRIDPKLEPDVQWVFINKLTIRDEMLMVTSERGATYQVDLRTKAITQRGPASSPAPGANEQPHDIPDVIKRAITTSSLVQKYDLSFPVK